MVSTYKCKQYITQRLRRHITGVSIDHYTGIGVIRVVRVFRLIRVVIFPLSLVTLVCVYSIQILIALYLSFFFVIMICYFVFKRDLCDSLLQWQHHRAILHASR
jgi:hypothetical protein